MFSHMPRLPPPIMEHRYHIVSNKPPPSLLHARPALETVQNPEAISGLECQRFIFTARGAEKLCFCCHVKGRRSGPAACVGRCRRVCLLAALFAFAPDALTRADARAAALLKFPPDSLVLAAALAIALLAFGPSALLLADARAPALLAPTPDALVRAQARAPALLAIALPALELADVRASSAAMPDSPIPIPLS